MYLKDCDYILLMKEGSICETGTHDELLQLDGEYARLIQTFHAEDEDDDADDRRESSNKMIDREEEKREMLGSAVKESKPPTGGKLIEEEGMESGVVSWATYRAFFSFGGAYCSFAFPLLFILLGNCSLVATNAWLAIWLRSADTQSQVYTYVDNGTDNATNIPYQIDPSEFNLSDRLYFYVGVYCGLFLLTIVMFVVSCQTYVNFLLRVATNLHNRLFVKIIESPMSFFDSTPVGRILNRFSKDMDEVDLDLPACLQRFLFTALFVVLGEVGACYFLPWNILLFVGIAPICIFCLRFFRQGFCDIKRLDNVCRSRLVSHLSATIQGQATIVAYGKSAHFIRKYESLLNSNTQLVELVQMAIRWVAVRLDSLAAINAGAVAVIVILWRAHMSNSIIAFVLFLATNLSAGTIQTMFVACTETESTFVAVERMLEYIQILQPEGPKTIKDSKPDSCWPEEGRVQFEGVQMKYRPDLPLVLKDIHLDIRPREKIGIVGRTGSGKSSLGVVLFRLVEMSAGSISIDGVDIMKIGLHDLRSRLSIIPQDPVLFIGTVRYNLDPFNEHSDADVWEALEKTHIKQAISSLEGKLEAPVVENGENFSVGERQLICMARALLRNSRVLLLDEATAAIDTETDSLIQQTIREAFMDCTMLIIAHRLNTVLDCDRILVMEQGQVGEFDSPANLLADANSRLASMLAAADRKQDTSV